MAVPARDGFCATGVARLDLCAPHEIAVYDPHGVLKKIAFAGERPPSGLEAVTTASVDQKMTPPIDVREIVQAAVDATGLERHPIPEPLDMQEMRRLGIKMMGRPG